MKRSGTCDKRKTCNDKFWYQNFVFHITIKYWDMELKKSMRVIIGVERSDDLFLFEVYSSGNSSVDLEVVRLSTEEWNEGV